MTSFKYWHVLQKFHSAVSSLATGLGDVRTRLHSAWYGPPLWNIKPEDLPESLQADFIWIEKQLQKYKEEHRGQIERIERLKKMDHSTCQKKCSSPCEMKCRMFQYPDPVEATLKRIKNITAFKIACRIFGIYESLTDLNLSYEKRRAYEMKDADISLSDLSPVDLSKYRN